VTGIVNRSEPSSSPEITSLKSRLMNVLLTMWSSAVGRRAFTASTIASTGTSFCSTIGRSPSTVPTTWTVVPSGESRPDRGPATNGSITCANVAVSTPSTVAFAAARSATSWWTVAWNAPSSAAPSPPSMTTTNRSDGATGSPAPSTS